MKINENGITRDMTAAEVAAYEAYLAAAPVEAPPKSDTRLDEIEAALMELAAIVGGDGNG